ncbi:unnamed protein product [Toxocara canis]|uniref:DUF2335 domain-containing protein n=1 Tax=Toxocara canis TaxID=6265 RepID=A0A183UD54_TOXCA|nr:unnamed protein product [Toxocara canis]
MQAVHAVGHNAKPPQGNIGIQQSPDCLREQLITITDQLRAQTASGARLGANTQAAEQERRNWTATSLRYAIWCGGRLVDARGGPFGTSSA